MQLTCPYCDKAVSAYIDTATASAKCPLCGKKIGLLDDISGDIPKAQFVYSKPDIEMPKRFSFTREGDRIEISYRWFSVAYLILAAICLAVDSFAGFVCYEIIAPLPIKLICLAPVSLGAWLTYYTAAGFVNKTFIRVSPGGMVIRYGPLPWPGERAIQKSGLEQLFCLKKRTGKGRRHYYLLCAAMRDGSRVELLPRFWSFEEAVFIEQQTEKTLAIEDRSTGGEMTPWDYV